MLGGEFPQTYFHHVGVDSLHVNHYQLLKFEFQIQLFLHLQLKLVEEENKEMRLIQSESENFNRNLANYGQNGNERRAGAGHQGTCIPRSKSSPGQNDLLLGLLFPEFRIIKCSDTF